jgi:endonuclease/exonuclease/phosphatase family metal-dependent hydrolase
MKLISLNTWGGRINKELINFIVANQNVDIFCFQEIYHRATHIHVAQGDIDPDLTLFDDIEKRLPNHKGYFRPHYLETFGLAMFIKKDINIVAEGEFFVHQHKGFIPEGAVGNHARNIQYITIQTEVGLRTIINFHGLWKLGAGKYDNEERLLQSENIVNFLKEFKNPYVLCGDFNLLPETESLKKLEALGLRNLIKEFGVTSTRTSFYTKESRFADYALVSDGIVVNDFKVLPDEVSDHSPLYLDFE